MDAVSVSEEAGKFDCLIDGFQAEWGVRPSIIARAPGRVNLIGEHIDYMGYGVLPLALVNHVAIAAGLIGSPSLEGAKGGGGIVCVNTDPSRFSTRRLSSTDAQLWQDDHSPDQGGQQRRSDWIHYVQAGLKGLLDSLPREQLTEARAKLEGVGLMVHGTVPDGAGLSSSSALVVASCMAFAWLVGHSLKKVELAQICTDCERYVGTAGGGMDQAVSCLAQEGAGLYITFDPLQATPTILPKGCAFVICNSMVIAEKAVSAATHFNKRVVECRLATLIMARSLGLPDWQRLRTLRQMEEALAKDNKNSRGPMGVGLFMELLEEGPYTIKRVTEALGMAPSSPPSLLVDTFFPDRAAAAALVLEKNSDFYLRDRVVHVVQEAARVRAFKALCDDSSSSLPETNLGLFEELGRLMDASHRDCRYLYDCSCPELDRLVSICKEAGALGSRLTGAGWGGSCVSLVPADRVPTFVEQVTRRYYYSLISSAADNEAPPGRREQYDDNKYSRYLPFVTTPGPGASYHKVPTLPSDDKGV